MAARPDLGKSPALAAAAASALGPTSIDQVGHLDLYSCFASSVTFARDALGITDGRSPTVTGGLPYHGGPGSNYGTHALAAMAQALRADPGSFGLVTGIGMHMTHHAASLWSTTPGTLTFPGPIPELPSVPVAHGVAGPARVATFSTVYDRNGPTSTALICDLADGGRCYARLEEPVPADVELVGAPVTLTPGPRGAHTATLAGSAT